MREYAHDSPFVCPILQKVLLIQCNGHTPAAATKEALVFIMEKVFKDGW